MKMLIAGLTKQRGGKETYLLTIYRELLQYGYEIDFLSTDPPAGYQKEITENGCRIFYVTPRRQNPFAYRKELAEIMAQGGYDLFWSHRTALSSIEEFEAAKKAGIPVRIIHSHNASLEAKPATRILHRYGKSRIRHLATDFFACSEEAARFMFPAGTKVFYAKNALDIEKYRYDAANAAAVKQNMGLGGMFAVGHIGRFCKEKNHHKILSVFREILKKKENCILLLAGSGPLMEQIRSEAERTGLQNKVRFLGERSDIPELLAAFDVLLFPSGSEGFGYAAIEAQAAGLPCIASDRIPASAVMSEFTERLPLEEKDEVWAEHCLSFYGFDRTKAQHHLRENGFDSRTESARLDAYFNEKMGRPGHC